MSDATRAAEALLGLPGFRVLEVQESPDELVIVIELVAETVGRPGCGVVARAHGRCPVDYRDLAAVGRPACLRWRKRRWRCEQPECGARTWTESEPPRVRWRLGHLVSGVLPRPAGALPMALGGRPRRARRARGVGVSGHAPRRRRAADRR